MALHKFTREALEWKAEIAGEQANGDDDAASWERIYADLEAALADDSLLHHDAAVGELLNYLGGDLKRGEAVAINTDLARAGWLEKFDAAATYFGCKPKTITVDGVEYVRE